MLQKRNILILKSDLILDQVMFELGKIKQSLQRSQRTKRTFPHVSSSMLDNSYGEPINDAQAHFLNSSCRTFWPCCSLPRTHIAHMEAVQTNMYFFTRLLLLHLDSDLSSISGLLLPVSSNSGGVDKLR